MIKDGVFPSFGLHLHLRHVDIINWQLSLRKSQNKNFFLLTPIVMDSDDTNWAKVTRYDREPKIYLRSIISTMFIFLKYTFRERKIFKLALFSVSI